jgi:hypothetical protein
MSIHDSVLPLFQTIQEKKHGLDVSVIQKKSLKTMLEDFPDKHKARSMSFISDHSLKSHWNDSVTVIYKRKSPRRMGGREKDPQQTGDQESTSRELGRKGQLCASEH